MKKVLILAYDFPPYFSMGAQRPWSWYLYFKEQGVYPVVITRYWDHDIKINADTFKPSSETSILKEETDKGAIIKVPYNAGFRDQIFIKFGERRLVFFRQFLSFIQSILQFIFFRFDGKKGLYFAAEDYLKENKVDFITATGEPYVLFRYAALLSKKFNIPWVADYRDCWSNFHEISSEARFFERIFNKWVNGYFEKKIVRTASFITCPGIVTKEKILELFPLKNVKVIYNGFFEEEKIEINKAENPSNNLVISFGGTIYPFQPLETFIEGIDLAVKKAGINIPLKVWFFGGAFFEDQKRRIFKNKEVNGFLEVTQRLRRNNLLSNYASSDFLLLFSNKKMISGKLFDYIKAGKPVLLVGEDGGEMEQIIAENNLGIICRSSEEVADFLIKYALGGNEFKVDKKKGAGSILKFSRRNQAKALRGYINDYIANHEIINNEYFNTCPACDNHQLQTLKKYQKAFLTKCMNCSFVFSGKKPSYGELAAYYENYSYSDQYYSSPLTRIRYFQILETLEKYRKNNRILDVGCGNGDFLMAAREKGWDCWGTEFSLAAVNLCKSKGLNVLHGSLEELAGQLPEFDVVVSIEVIEHINNPKKETELIYKLLRPMGLFYVTTPNFNSIMRIILKNKFDIIVYPEHLGYFTPLSLTTLMRSSGFKKIKTTTTGFSFNRFFNSMFGRSQDPFSPHSLDERFRITLESNFLFRRIKTFSDRLFNLFGTGLSLKGWFEKDSLDS